MLGSWGTSNRFEAFSGVFKSLSMFSVSDAFVWLPSLTGSMHGSAPLAGKSEFSDMFAGVFELPAFICMYICALSMSVWVLSPSDRPKHNLGLLVGESGDFASAEHVLTRSCMSLAVFVWSATPIGARAVSRLDLHTIPRSNR